MVAAKRKVHVNVMMLSFLDNINHPFGGGVESLRKESLRKALICKTGNIKKEITLE
jgi:hypothetical protein